MFITDEPVEFCVLSTFYSVFNCFISCQNIAHVQTPFPFLLGLQVSLETRTNSERREQILAQSCLRADQTRWSCCVILSNTIVLRRGVVGPVLTIKVSCTPATYYEIANAIRFKNGLCTHICDCDYYSPHRKESQSHSQSQLHSKSQV